MIDAIIGAVVEIADFFVNLLVERITSCEKKEF